MSKTNIKLCLVSSPGGHLTKLIKLKPWWEQHERFWVTHVGSGQVESLPNERIIAGCFPENRNLVNFVKNLILAWQVLTKERPNMIVSMGAGIAVPFFLIARMLRIRSIFIETLLLVSEPTVSGKIIYPLADVFVVQNRGLKKIFPKAVVKEWQL